jgi:ribosome biogenesis ATPase
VGESERAVRRVFERARSSAPCVIFFDELDALAPRRGGSFTGGAAGNDDGSGNGGGGGGVSERVVNQLLTELDGLESRRSVFVIAATNRPELIDPAMMRPGRLDKRLYVPLPSQEERASILIAVARKAKVARGVDLAKVAVDSRTEGYSGADLAALVREAGLAMLRELPRPTALTFRNKRHRGEEGNSGSIENNGGGTHVMEIDTRHFETALEKVRPSVGLVDRERYLRMRDTLEDGGGR